MKANAGKWAEAQVQSCLDSLSKSATNFAYHRFPDARAARGSLASQPSDHLVIHKSTPVFLETKDTAELRRLPRTKVSQYGSLMKMAWAGALVVVIVHRSAFKDWVMLTNYHLFPDNEETPASFPFEGLKSYPSADAALKEIFA